MLDIFAIALLLLLFTTGLLYVSACERLKGKRS